MNREDDDVITIKVSDEPIDYAEEIGSMIVHFTKDGKAVLFEILNATDFFSDVRANQLVKLEKARLIGKKG